MPAGHSCPPTLAAARAMRACPPRSPAFTSRALSGLPGAIATAPSAASASEAGFHGTRPDGSVVRSTLTPIISGSVQADTSYGRTISLPGDQLGLGIALRRQHLAPRSGRRAARAGRRRRRSPPRCSSTPCSARSAASRAAPAASRCAAGMRKASAAPKPATTSRARVSALLQEVGAAVGAGLQDRVGGDPLVVHDVAQPPDAARPGVREVRLRGRTRRGPCCRRRARPARSARASRAATEATSVSRPAMFFHQAVFLVPPGQ